MAMDCFFLCEQRRRTGLLHRTAKRVGIVQATTKCRKDVQDDRSGTIKLERFAILEEYRGKHFGKEAFTFLVNKLEEDYNPCTIYFNAQYHLLDYYRSLGFKEEGDTFYEANIKHIKMVRNVK